MDGMIPLLISLLAGPARHAAPRGADAFLAEACLPCHGADEREANLDLRPLSESLSAGTAQAGDRAVLRKALARLEAGEMPPPAKGEQPMEATARAAGAMALRAALRTSGELPAPPGAPPRRLNRAEYCYSIQDILGVDPATLGALPPDDVGAGFDNVAAVLSLPPSALERYADLAEVIAQRACPDHAPPQATLLDVMGAELRIGAGKARDQVAVVWSRGAAVGTFVAPAEGIYEATVSVGGMQAGPDPVKMAIEVDGAAALTSDVPETAAAPGERRVAFRAGPGSHEVGAAFLNDYFVKDGPGGKPADRNMVVHRLTVRGPMQPPAPPRWMAEMATAVPGDPAMDADDRERAELAWLARRFLRRPASDADIASLRAAIDPATAGMHREARLRAAVVALLLHPEFLFRIEHDPAPDAAERALAPHEVASRLASFLWCSVPDEALAAAADAGLLDTPEGLRSQLARMLDDPRASRLTERFVPQWLAIDAVEERAPDPRRFQGVDAALLGSMRAESVLFVDTVLRERRPVSSLLGAGFTFADARLAAHYGIPAPAGGGMRRVPAPPDRDAGILTHASVLLCTSNPTRTSPVKRGRWVLESLLDAPPPPPPPGTAQLPANVGTPGGGSMRELLAAHRADAACAACHRRMDALGFVFESWDPVGRRRDRLADGPVDDRGELPDGRVLAGTAALRAELRGNPAFTRSLLRHLTTFAFGRECTPRDEDLIDRAMDALGPDPVLQDLVIAVATGPAMRKRGTP